MYNSKLVRQLGPIPPRRFVPIEVGKVLADARQILLHLLVRRLYLVDVEHRAVEEDRHSNQLLRFHTWDSQSVSLLE